MSKVTNDLERSLRVSLIALVISVTLTVLAISTAVIGGSQPWYFWLCTAIMIVSMGALLYQMHKTRRMIRMWTILENGSVRPNNHPRRWGMK